MRTPNDTRVRGAGPSRKPFIAPKARKAPHPLQPIVRRKRAPGGSARTRPPVRARGGAYFLLLVQFVGGLSESSSVLAHGRVSDSANVHCGRTTPHQHHKLNSPAVTPAQFRVFASTSTKPSQKLILVQLLRRASLQTALGQALSAESDVVLKPPTKTHIETTVPLPVR